MNRVINIIFSIALFSLLFILNSKPTYALAQLEGGNFATVFNNTTQAGTWRDPIDAKPGEIVEFRVTAKNIGNEVASRVQVWGSTNGQVPQGPASQLVMTSKIATASFGGNEVTDTVTVNVIGGTAQGLRYLPGHIRIQGVTNLHNCPSACALSDSVNVLGGFEVGDIQPGAFIEVTFKATVTNAPSSPSPAPSAAPSTAPTSGPTQTVTQTNNQTVNVTQTAAQPAVAGVTTLPKTGLPLAVLLGLGSLPVGLILKKFSKGPASEETADSIWDGRQLKLDS